MIGRAIGAMVGRKLTRRAGMRDNGLMGAVMGTALASRRTRKAGLLGLGALAAYRYFQQRRGSRRTPY